MIGQTVDRSLQSGQRRGARGVRGKIGSAQVEHRRHAAGGDVGQLAGHGIFGGVGKTPAHRFPQLRQQGCAVGLGQRLEDLRVGDGVHILGREKTQAREVVQLTAHGIAQDHAGRFGVERPVGMARVAQRLARAQQSPLLAVIHGGRYRGRDAILGGLEGHAAHPAANLGIRLARCLGIRVVVVGRIPAIRRDLADRIPAGHDVLPEGLGVERIGQYRPHANDGDGSFGRIPCRTTHFNFLPDIENGKPGAQRPCPVSESSEWLRVSIVSLPG